MIDGVQKVKWAATVSRELGIDVISQIIRVKTDSDAARSFVNRRGLGRMRHVEVRDLWLQEEVREGKVVVERIPGEEDPADLMTKFVRTDEAAERLRRMGMTWLVGKVGDACKERRRLTGESGGVEN